MVKLISYLSEDNILEFSEYKESETLEKLFKTCVKDYSEEINKRVTDILEAKKNGKCLNLTKAFALTHIRLDEVDNIKVSIGLFGKKVKINKSNRVQALFCLVIPESKCQTYLGLIAHLTRLLSEDKAESVFRSGNRKGIMEFIESFEEI
jgi:mannitol/fructose-specific phosphotransferase system IIA component (Ntr-type)